MCAICQTGSNELVARVVFFVPICPLPPRLDRRRKAEEEEMQEEVEGQVAVAASSVARRLAVLSEQTILSSMDLDRRI